jgi:hypothetical protein
MSTLFLELETLFVYKSRPKRPLSPRLSFVFGAVFLLTCRVLTLSLSSLSGLCLRSVLSCPVLTLSLSLFLTWSLYALVVQSGCRSNRQEQADRRCLVMPCLVLPFLSTHLVICLVLFCLGFALSCLGLSWLGLAWLVLSCPVLSCFVLSCFVLTCACLLPCVF